MAQPRIAFGTVATSDHAAMALGLLQSIRAQHPAAQFSLLLVDAQLKVPHWVRALPLERCIDAAKLASMRGRYSKSELCFAAKPFLLRRLLEDGVDQAHYLDADCRVYAPLTQMVEQLAGADLLLTPHTMRPVPDDGCRPRPLTLLRAGVFNGGYLGVRNTSGGLAFASWLAGMTVTHARNAPRLGMCGDQRWLDLAPALFPGTAICRHGGANVAYWNLHGRAITDEEMLAVDGEPLLFFHFSGFEGNPLRLSRHQDRVTVEPYSALHRLLQRYAAETTVSDRASLLDSAKRIARQWLRPASGET
jgi:hypothetical protein